MKIISVSRYKGTTFQAVLDDGRTLYLHSDIIADFSVRPELEIESDELKKIVYASNFRRAFQRALFLLDYRDYSSSEMMEKLTANYKNERLCSDVIKKLTDNGLIDDRRYSERLAQKLVETKKYGYRRAKRELMQKGIDKFMADDVLGPYSDMYAENIMHLLKNKYSRWLTDESDRKNTEKVKNALVRYGYDFSEINSAVKDYFEEDN